MGIRRTRIKGKQIKKWTRLKRDKHIRMKKRGRKRIMATQIAVTPILYGNEARKVIEEIKVKPNEKSKENARRLLEYFNKLTSRGE